MTRITKIVAVAALVLSAASPAAASDLLFRKSDATPLTDTVIGQPFWVLQAQCAGLFGAMANYSAQRGEPAKAEAAKQEGVRFMNDALERLRSDRGLDRKAALAEAGPQLNIGRAHGLELLSDERTDSLSGWNAERSFCLDVRDAYHRKSL